MICTKCFIDKPVEEYDTYYHSTQKKQRTRKYCKSCFKEQKRLYKESIKTKKIMEPLSVIEEPVVIIPQPVEVVNPLSTNPNYRLCRTCQEYIHINDYYNFNSNKHYLDCRICCNKREADKRKQERQEQIENGGGSEMVSSKPNTYKDKYQQQQTFMVMEVLGYTYQDGVWLKPGTKELVNGKLVFPKLKKLKYIGHKHIDYNDELWDLIWKDFNDGINQRQLSKKHGYSTTTICNFINRKKNG
jgi:hypothetical protein